MFDRRVTVCVFLPNQACWSPCTSIARPKSASFTAAPFILLANNRFSGWGRQTHGEAECRTRDQDSERQSVRHSSLKLFLRNIHIWCIWHSLCGGVRKWWKDRGWVVENLHALYGHGFVSIETSRESFRQRCRLHAKWKEYLAKEQGVWQCCRWLLDMAGGHKSPLRIKGQQIRQQRSR